jgi:hypothetical protein
MPPLLVSTSLLHHSRLLLRSSFDACIGLCSASDEENAYKGEQGDHPHTFLDEARLKFGSRVLMEIQLQRSSSRVPLWSKQSAFESWRVEIWKTRRSVHKSKEWLTKSLSGCLEGECRIFFNGSLLYGGRILGRSVF